MSYWGAAVITNLLGVISQDLVYFIWGNFSVANATLNRFYSLHYLLPFILLGLVLLHLLTLHQDASNNPEGIESLSERIRFHPYYTSKDLVGFFLFLLIFSIIIFWMPNYLGHPDNSIPANPLVTPHSIQPEWYYLSFYAILRSIPDKTFGVIGMFSSIIILAFLPLSRSTIRSNRFKPLMNILFFFFICNFFFLIWLGAKPIYQPYIFISQIATAFYFLYFILLLIIP
jgi:quinol-cytochrome oxidoreductase complex cytochrome b subunit